MQLIDSPNNPVPAGAQPTMLATRDGVQLRVASWRRIGGEDRGTVILLQGRAEFIEKYFETVGELRARGFDVVTFDWRGQGGSDRALPDRHRGHVRHFDDFRLDYEAVRAHFAAATRGRPVCVLAHSMGGCIALTGAYEGWLAADRLVASSPMLSLKLVRRPLFAQLLARFLMSIGLGSRVVPGGQAQSISTLPFQGNRLCTDPVRYARNAAVAEVLDWGAIGSPTVGWVVAAYEAMKRLSGPDVPRSIVVPTLVVAGGDDPICSTPAIELFARALKRATLVVVPGARHEVLMETDPMRALFWTAFDAFMATATTAEPAPALVAV